MEPGLALMHCNLCVCLYVTCTITAETCIKYIHVLKRARSGLELVGTAAYSLYSVPAITVAVMGLGLSHVLLVAPRDPIGGSCKYQLDLLEALYIYISLINCSHRPGIKNFACGPKLCCPKTILSVLKPI